MFAGLLGHLGKAKKRVATDKETDALKKKVPVRVRVVCLFVHARVCVFVCLIV